MKEGNLKKERDKFTTTLEPEVIEYLGILKAKRKTRGINYIIEELVKKEWERVLNENSREK